MENKERKAGFFRKGVQFVILIICCILSIGSMVLYYILNIGICAGVFFFYLCDHISCLVFRRRRK